MLGVVAFLCWGSFAVMQTITAPRVARGGMHPVKQGHSTVSTERRQFSEVQQVGWGSFPLGLKCCAQHWAFTDAHFVVPSGCSLNTACPVVVLHFGGQTRG
jgi:hypothetical protein